MRLFIGIPLPNAVIDELSTARLRLQAPDDELRWTAPESWHITLQFLGSTPQEQYACVAARLRELRLPPIPVKLGQPGYFERAGVFFIEVQDAAELLIAQQRISATTRLCGFIPESRPFAPHITLARTKGKGGRMAFEALKARIWRPPSFTSFIADEVLLYESITSAAGARYEIRDRFPIY